VVGLKIKMIGPPFTKVPTKKSKQPLPKQPATDTACDPELRSAVAFFLPASVRRDAVCPFVGPGFVQSLVQLLMPRQITEATAPPPSRLDQE